MSRFPYQFFEEYVVRTPLFSYKTFTERISRDQITDSELKEIYSDNSFQEAVYLASPYLYKELQKWLLSEKEFTSKDQDRLKNTLLKYYSRISSRCTPFGLFSGVSIGEFSKDVSSLFNADNKKIRDTKLDMHLLVSLYQYFTTIPDIRNKLIFYPNTSIYKVGDRIRFIEYEYSNGKREYIISSASCSNELQRILDFSQQGKTIQQIVEILTSKDITAEEAKEFIEELIDNQILLSELEPNVSGGDFLHTLITILKRKGIEKEYNTLISIQYNLEELDKNILNPISNYYKIENLIKTFQTKYEPKFLFQTDLYYQNKTQLSTRWKKELRTGISFLNKITQSDKNTHLEKFKKAFSERFEAEEVPLLYALDTEIGIGYKQYSTAKGVHSYLEDLEFPIIKEKQERQIKLNSIKILLNQKLQEAQWENNYVIQLTDNDFSEYEEKWEDLPNTLSFMGEVISENREEKLLLKGGGGSVAANLLARFCSEKSEIQNIVKNIANKESELDSDYILAEIIHLPEARIGNVIRRPTLREYEIPYMAKSVLSETHQISMIDLYISLRDGKLVLRSKKLNKELKPCLTNAHNYSANSLPVYHFLCDLHSQNIRTGLQFDWGDLMYLYTFFPRVEYKNIIFSKASWKVTEREIQFLDIVSNDQKQFINQFNTWRTKRKIPIWIQWIRSDNSLTLNLENYSMIKMFIQIIKKEKSLFIEEFLYNENHDFMHQYVFPMYKAVKNK